MSRILILYSTTDGHTISVCRFLVDVLERHGNSVTLVDMLDPKPPDPATFDKVVIGASIRYGKHAKIVHDTIARHLAALASRPGAFFSVNLVARKPNRDRPDNNPYVKKFLRQIAWRPDHVGVFAGKLNYPIYSLADRLIIQLIMWITKGPTDPTTVREFTDWGKVETFAEVVDGLEHRDPPTR